MIPHHRLHCHPIFRLLLTALLLPLVSCISTEVEEPPVANVGNLVTLTVSAPGFYNFGSPTTQGNEATRADQNHKLRLVVHLYASGSTTPIKSQELLPNGSETTLSFQIQEQGDYFVTVFGDYIDPVNAIDGHYADKYYDTSASASGLIKSLTNSEQTEVLTDFFNNDNRDCFVGKIVFKKGLQEVNSNLVLKRAVCRVGIGSPGDDVESLIESIDITSCSHLDTYRFSLDSSATTGTVAKGETDGSDTTIEATPIRPENENIHITSPGRELFYFYTFAGEEKDAARPSLGEISFNLNSRNGQELTETSRSVPAGLIKPAVNYRISVNGSQGWISARPGGNDITITVIGLDNWGNSINPLD